MSDPHAILGVGGFPEVRLLGVFDGLENAEAMVMAMAQRLKRYRDWQIIGTRTIGVLKMFSLPELENILRCFEPQYQNIKNVPSRTALPGVLMNLAERVAAHLARCPVDETPSTALMLYRQKNPLKEPRNQEPEMTETTETTTSAAPATKTAKKPAVAKAAAKAAKPHGKAKPAGPATPKAAAKKTPSKAQSGGTSTKKAAPDDALGRPGSLFRFVAERLLKGEDSEKIGTAVAKVFPNNKPVKPKDVAWYRWKLGQKGVKLPAA